MCNKRFKIFLTKRILSTVLKPLSTLMQSIIKVDFESDKSIFSFLILFFNNFMYQDSKCTIFLNLKTTMYFYHFFEHNYNF